MKIKIKFADLGIICFLIASCFTFVLEYMISDGSATSYVIGTSIMMFFLLTATLLLGGRAKGIIGYNWVWMFYMVAIVISFLRRSFAVTTMCDVMIILLTLLGVMVISQSTDCFQTGIKFLSVVGFVNALAVLVQYVLGDTYNIIYWRLFTDTWREYAQHYYESSYYMGIQAVPGQAAGAILFAIGITACFILLAKYEKKQIRHKWICYLSIIVMLLALLLTGKKGIIISGIVAFMILSIILFAQKKQWIRLLLLLLAIVIGYHIFRWYVLTHDNVPFFYRFAQFFIALEEGNEGDLTTGRNYLYRYAIELWKEHKLLGIGWRTFRDYSVYLYGYDTKHDVNLDYLQILCECGIIGFVFFIIPVCTTLFRTLKLARKILKMEMNFTGKFTVIVAGFIQFFTLIYAFLEIPFYDRTFFIIYAFSCIIINNAYREQSRIERGIYEN